MRRLMADEAKLLGGKTSEGTEVVFWTGKPTVLAFYDALAGGGLLIIVSALLLLLPLPGILLLSAIGVACGLLFIVFAFVKAWANTYTVTDKCVRRQYRFVAVRVEEAPFEKVTNTVLEQDIVGRIFRFGDIRFDTAGTPFMGVLFKGVKNPSEVKRLIDEKMKGALGNVKQ